MLQSVVRYDHLARNMFDNAVDDHWIAYWSDSEAALDLCRCQNTIILSLVSVSGPSLTDSLGCTDLLTNFTNGSLNVSDVKWLGNYNNTGVSTRACSAFTMSSLLCLVWLIKLTIRWATYALYGNVSATRMCTIVVRLSQIYWKLFQAWFQCSFRQQQRYDFEIGQDGH